MENVLITGADGFIGSHLAELLVAKGFNVRALTQYDSQNSWGWLDSIHCLDDIEVVSGDIRDPFFCRKITEKTDRVFHLAALIAIPYSYKAPASYVETNVQGTLNICQAALDNDVKRVVHTSTSEVYGTAQYVPIDEMHPLQPQSPYSASKIGADSMAMSFYHAFGLPVTIARPFNTYGPRQSARAVIPTIITQIAKGMDSIKLGDVTPTRDFNYVEDTCAALLALSESDKTLGETLNIASGSEISIGDTLNLLRELMKSKVTFLTDQQRLRPGTSEVYRLWGDSSKLQELTGFKPAHDLKSGLRKTIDWFTKDENLQRYKANIYNV
ncbi:NAD-dependent 4,6-dehydratase LegB [Lacimicrobium alkaliphilum]|uniref:NAD-dependent dehydratase n=1 Tax=Lacimicrobium alkaliphilum TaxID=1526571 RepID=A0ABQ1RN98_9ALTE|nr:NAD-dependent 4,6-dehydratase LegB [Lacimicrobium alkaliphilum]GGD72561.1 NAD-dependent dehydratase [Lacimicrobium alkaliphilum]